MDIQVGSSIVRIHNTNGVVVGIGFLVREDILLSCCHVINVALGRSKESKDKPSEYITLDFPFLKNKDLLQAYVLEWYPKEGTSGDIAVLKLNQTKPQLSRAARLVSIDEFAGHPFAVYGCPADFQQDGRWVEGILQRLLPNGRLQVMGTSNLAYFIESGFSGGPVWDDTVKGVIGMVVSVDTSEDKLQASIIPINTIKTYYSSLYIEGPIFISYSHVDGSEYAQHVEAFLKREYFEVLIADEGEQSGDYRNKLSHKSIESSSVVIVIMTPGAVDSIRVENEWNYALDLGKKIIPLIMRSCELPRVLSILDYFDLRNYRDHDSQLSLLVNTLRNTNPKIMGTSYKETVVRSKAPGQYPIVVGQRLSTTIDYFQNRQDQLAEIGRLLSEPGTRIVSVVGSSGIGKTALVSKFLHSLEHNIWPHISEGSKVDGILYLSHRTVGISLERIFLGCAEMLDHDFRLEMRAVWVDTKLTIADKIQRLIDAMSQGLYVILLDNIEDILNERGNIIDPEIDIFIQAVLISSGKVRIIVTSREPIAFNHQNAPLDKRVLLHKGLDIHHGVLMLREADPSGLYGLKDADNEMLAKIVEMVHGVPRALEVFVGIVKDEKSALLTIEEVMESFFKHPMTEKELILEGYRRLDVNARRILEGLSVFGRPVPIGAVRFLLEPFVPDVDITNEVLRLIRIHMISVVDKQHKLIALHPMDRDFAYSQIP